MLLLNKLPSYLLGKYQLIGTVTFAVLFAVVFLNIYIPFSDTAWFVLGGGDARTFFYTLTFVMTSIVSLIFSRMIMYRLGKTITMTYLSYMIWCILEIMAVGGIYTWITLINNPEILELPVEIFSRSLLYGAISLGIPYLIAGMYFAIIDKNNTIRLMNFENVVTDEAPRENASMQKITLFDNSGSLKLSVSTDNLLYIESDDNYIKVWYTDSKGELKQYMLRCRLKTVEDSFKGSGLVRCNRKYIVNIKKVATLRKEGDTYYLDLACEEIPPLPVTKTYTDRILAYFMEERPLMEVIDE